MSDLHIKYRPKTFNEMFKTSGAINLKNDITNIPHVMLFYGHHGTGKTSLAYIIYRILNCKNLNEENEPCKTCEECIDTPNLIVIDTKKDMKLDDARALSNEIANRHKFNSLQDIKYVYLIDEIHNLRKDCQEALYKAIEDYCNNHVYLIGTTTDVTKLNHAFKSRFTMYRFSALSKPSAIKFIKQVLEKENVKEHIEEISNIILSSITEYTPRDILQKINEYQSTGNVEAIVEDENVYSNIYSILSMIQTTAIHGKGRRNRIINTLEKVLNNFSPEDVRGAMLRKLEQSIFNNKPIEGSKVKLTKSQISLDISKFLLDKLNYPEALDLVVRIINAYEYVMNKY